MAHDDGDRDDRDRDQLHDYLTVLDRDVLVGLLVEAAAADPALAGRLRDEAVGQALRVAVDQVSTLPAEVLMRVLESALGADAHLSGVLALLRAAVADAAPGTAVRLVQRAVERCEDRVAAPELAELHLAACVRARPEPALLGAWLAERHLLPGRAEAPSPLEAYATLLGEEGLAVYADLLTTVWDQHPDVGRARTLARRMEDLHTLRGDTDAVVAVLATDLGDAGRHLRIAELLVAADRTPEAVAWAERGLAATPAGRVHDSRLLDFLGPRYRGGHGEPGAYLALHREQFARRPDAAAFRVLAAAVDAGDWPEQRAWALAELHRRAARPSARSWENPAAPLIAVLLAEGDPDAAWDAALRYQAGHPTLLRLAELRAADHLEEAVPVYRAEIELQIEAATRESFRAAAERTAQLCALLRRTEPGERQADLLLAELRSTHRNLGNLLAALDTAGL